MERLDHPVKFTNRRVAKHFECTYHHNPIVHVPGIYRGLLSDVTFAGAQAMVKQKHAAIRPKEVTPPSPQVADNTGSTE